MVRIPSELDSTEEKTVYPLMWMASLEPVRIRKEKFLTLLPFNIGAFDQFFSLHFSATKKEKDGPAKLSYVISSLNIFLPPDILSLEFEDAESDEAKDFLTRPLSNFHPFKKAILLFEKKPHTMKEFEEIVLNWKKELEQRI